MNKQERNSLESKQTKYEKIKGKTGSFLLSAIYVSPMMIGGSILSYTEQEKFMDTYHDNIVNYLGKVGYWLTNLIPEILAGSIFICGGYVAAMSMKGIYEDYLIATMERKEKSKGAK